MGPNGKRYTEQLLAGVDGAVLTDIPDDADVRYVDIIAHCAPADILNSLNGNDTTPGIMYRPGDVLHHDTPSLVVVGIGEIAIDGNGTDPDEEFVIITCEDLAANLPAPQP